MTVIIYFWPTVKNIRQFETLYKKCNIILSFRKFTLRVKKYVIIFTKVFKQNKNKEHEAHFWTK